MATQTGGVDEQHDEGDGDPGRSRRPTGNIFAGREPVPCPYCKSPDTECVALFGPVLLTSQYYCKQCHSAFEVVKD
jgi:hypothetical protein